jgi:protein TonB
VGDSFVAHQRIAMRGGISFEGPVERKRSVVSRMRRESKRRAIVMAVVLHGLAALALVPEMHRAQHRVTNVAVTLQMTPAAVASHPAPMRAALPVAKTVAQPAKPAPTPPHAAPAVPVAAKPLLPVAAQPPLHMAAKPPLPVARPVPRRQVVVLRHREPPRLAPRAPQPPADRPVSAQDGQAAPVEKPVPAPAAAASPAASPAAVTVAVSPSWQSQLDAWLEAHRRYPEAAREYGQEGTATIRFTVARDGQVTNVALVNGSGVAQLDDAAMRMLQGAIVPAFPAAMAQAEMTITVRINYALDDDPSD